MLSPDRWQTRARRTNLSLRQFCSGLQAKNGFYNCKGLWRSKRKGRRRGRRKRARRTRRTKSSSLQQSKIFANPSFNLTKKCFLSYFLKKFVTHWYYLFLNLFTRKAWSWDILCGKVLNYKCSFFHRYRAIHVFISSFVSFDNSSLSVSFHLLSFSFNLKGFF